MARSLFAFALWVCALPLMAAVGNTAIEYSRVDDEAMIRAWNITQKELTQYREYMQTTGQYYYSHLDPVMVLGISSNSEKDRARFARLYIQNEVTMRLQEQQFVTAVGHAHTRLYGTGKRYDFSSVPGFNKRAIASANSLEESVQSNPVYGPGGPLPLHKIDGYQWTQRNALVSVDLLVEDDCEGCLAQFDSLLSTTPVHVIVNVYSKGAQQGILKQLHSSSGFANRSPARIVNFKRYDALLWDAIDQSTLPVTVIRHNGIAVARGA